MNPDETVNGKIFKLNNKEIWNGKVSILIEFNKSNTAQDSTTSSHLLQQINYYHDKHTIWKLLYGYYAYVNDNTTRPFGQST